MQVLSHLELAGNSELDGDVSRARHVISFVGRCRARNPLQVLLRCLPLMSTLAHLDLAYCPVTDATLSILPLAGAVLRTLVLARSCENVWSCGLWTPRGVQQLLDSLPDLRIVTRL